jgi:hypothetical protein
MKGMILAVCVLACLLVGSGCMTGGYTTTERTVLPAADSLALTKHDIIEMSQAKVGDDVIIKMIRTTDSYFRLRSRDVVELADSGVSDKVIEAMIRTPVPQAEPRTGYYYAPYYYPAYWWGAYPFYYPWSFGFSVGYYAPDYHRTYVVPHHVYRKPYYRSGTPYSSGRSYGGNSHGGGRSVPLARPAGYRR